jgi:hypothetical protein
MIEHLLSKCKDLSSKFITTRKGGHIFVQLIRPKEEKLAKENSGKIETQVKC